MSVPTRCGTQRSPTPSTPEYRSATPRSSPDTRRPAHYDRARGNPTATASTSSPLTSPASNPRVHCAYRATASDAIDAEPLVCSTIWLRTSIAHSHSCRSEDGFPEMGRARNTTRAPAVAAPRRRPGTVQIPSPSGLVRTGMHMVQSRGLRTSLTERLCTVVIPAAAA
jgi:hypothetical protein